MQILAPRWIRPHLLTAGQTFELVIDTNEPLTEAAVYASLVRDGASQPLEVSVRAGTGHGGPANRIVADCHVPSDATMGVWDVRANIGERTGVVPQCVRVIERFSEAFTFVHMTDLHVWCKATDLEVEDRSPLVERVVEQINAIEPEFVLNTGDLYSRYGTRPPEVFSPEEVERQAITVRELLLKLNAPMFATPGNHDVAFPWSRASWARHMGYPHTGEPDDYSFDFGNCHFTALDGGRTYDEATLKITNFPFTDAQLAWLKDDLARARDSAYRILFLHYDYQRQLHRLVPELNIDAVFCGHTGKSPFEPREGDPPDLPTLDGFVDGLLAGRFAYQTVRVDARGIHLERGPTWNELRETCVPPRY